MKTLATSIVAALFVVTLSPVTDAAPVNLPSKSSIIIKPQRQTPVDVQPTTPQPNFSGNQVPVGTSSTPSAEQPTAATPLDTIPSLNYDPVVTLKDTYRKIKWKSDDRFEISRIDGLNSSYYANEQISFEVTGWSSNLEVNEENGFNVMATLYELPTNRTNRAKTTYNQDTRVWQVKFHAARDNTKEYKILINLYCAKNNSLCANTFGLGTQVDKISSVQMF